MARHRRSPLGGASVREARAPRRVGALILLILLSLSFQLAAPDENWARLVAIVLQGLTLVVALWASAASRYLIRTAAIAVAGAIALGIAALAGGYDLGSAPSRLVTLSLVALAPVAIIAGIRRDFIAEGAVTLRTMFGVLCVYLLIGAFFAASFGLVEQVGGEPFFAAGIEGDASDFLYFSFSTITTTGYGDLTAGTDVARSLAVTEALVGQIYLVTIVALIVTNLRPRRRTA